MSRKLELLLREWGDFNILHMEHHLELGENILYRAGIMGGRVQDAGDGHKILCPDMPRRLQRVDIGLKRIDTIPALVVKSFYCAPINPENGRNYTKSEIASLIRATGIVTMSLDAFEKNLRRGRKDLKRVIWKTVWFGG